MFAGQLDDVGGAAAHKNPNEPIVGEFSVENFARYSFALYVIAVLAAGTPGMAEIVSSLRVKSKDFQEAFFAITREFFGVFSLRLLRFAGTFGHFYSSP